MADDGDGYPKETVRWDNVPTENREVIEQLFDSLVLVAPCDSVKRFYITVCEVKSNLWTALMGIPTAGEGTTTDSETEELVRRRTDATTGGKSKLIADSADIQTFIALLRLQTGKRFRLPTTKELRWAAECQVIDTIADAADKDGKGFHLALDTIGNTFWFLITDSNLKIAMSRVGMLVAIDESEFFQVLDLNGGVLAEDVLEVRFVQEQDETTNIDAIEKENNNILKGIVNNRLSLVGAKGTVELFAISGVMIKSVPATQQETIIDVSNLSAGVYVIRCGKQSLKFTKK